MISEGGGNNPNNALASAWFQNCGGSNFNKESIGRDTYAAFGRIQYGTAGPKYRQFLEMKESYVYNNSFSSLVTTRLLSC